MKPIAITLVTIAGALSLGGCVPPNARGDSVPLKPVSQLDCRKRQGELTLVSAAPDGASCRYTAKDGSEVELRLVKVGQGGPDAALDGVESELSSLLPAKAASDAGSDTDVADAAEDAQADADAHVQAHAETHAAGRAASPDDGDHVDINMPGLHIQADGNRARVNVAGVNVDADDRTQNVHVRGGPGPWGRHGQFSVDANDRGAIIRARSGGPNVRSTLIMASDDPGAAGWRAVGYQARGPRSGPLVVAVIRARGDDHDRVFEDAKRLAWRAARAD